MDIIQHVVAPKILVDYLKKEQPPVKRVIFRLSDPNEDNKLAGFLLPDLREIHILMDIIVDRVIPTGHHHLTLHMSALLLCVITTLHEIIHMEQYIRGHLEWSHRLEKEATDTATDQAMKFLENAGNIPKKDFGYIGEEVTALLKRAWQEADHTQKAEDAAAIKQLVWEQMECWGMAKAAVLENFLSAQKYTQSMDDRIKKLVQSGQVGKQGKHGIYLSFQEWLYLVEAIEGGSTPFNNTKLQEKEQTAMRNMTNAERIQFILEVGTVVALFDAGQNPPLTTGPKWAPWVVSEHFSIAAHAKVGMCDVTLNLGGKTRNFRFVAQNKNKTGANGQLSQYAIAARQGHTIVWLIDTPTNTFLGRIEDGRWIPNQQQAKTRSVYASPPKPPAPVSTMEYSQFGTDRPMTIEEVENLGVDPPTDDEINQAMGMPGLTADDVMAAVFGNG